MTDFDLGTDFRLGEFLVEPARARISGPGGERRLPRAELALLISLADHAPRAVDRNTLKLRALPDYAALLEQKSAAVVSVKYVLKMRMNLGGQSQDQEQNGEIRGVVVDPSGLVMISNEAIEGPAAMLRRMMARRGGGNPHGVSATPTDLKVLFGNESKEHDAILVARDTNLGLAFLQVLDLEGRTPAAADLSKGAEPRVDQTLVAVSRHGRGFDCAPRIERMLCRGASRSPVPCGPTTAAAPRACPPTTRRAASWACSRSSRAAPAWTTAG